MIDQSSREMRASPKSASRRRWPAMTAARRSSSNASAPSSSAAMLEILRRELDAGAAERVGDGRRRIGEHRHVGRHRLDERHAETFVLAERDVDRRVAVVDRELLVGNRAR